jgi:positive phototaxis protein PixI
MNNSSLELPSLPTDRDPGDAYLKLQLDRQTLAVLPMEYAQEVLVVPARRITPMPNMPACILGLLNQRSKVFWVIDLPQLLGLSVIETYVQQYSIAILKVEDISIGLVVQQVKGVTRLSANTIQPPADTIADSLIPYLRGCISQQTDVVLVLDPEAIANSPLIHDSNQ